MSHFIHWDPLARKQLQKLPKEIASRIVRRVDLIKDNIMHYVESLVGRDDFKLRIGDYRLFLDVDENKKEVWIRTLRHRREAYKHHL